MGYAKLGGIAWKTMNKSFTLSRPQSFGKKNADIITNYNPKAGDRLVVNLNSFGIAASDYKRAAFGLGSCKAAISKGASREEAFLYQYKSGCLYFNENGSEPGLGNGGLFAILKGAPQLGAVEFSSGQGV